MYIIQVQNLDKTKTEYYRAANLTEAKLYQMQSVNFVNIFTAQDFLSRLPRVRVEKKRSDFDVIL